MMLLLILFLNDPIDDAVAAALKSRGIAPAAACTDEVFVRRVFLDVIGTVPEPAEVKAFLDDKSPTKRAALIDKLLERPEFADYWSMKWCDLLRVKSEFPINLWPNAVQAYHRWIHDAIRTNMPYDQFARALLTSSGSNFRVPAVNFYRAVQGRTPADLGAVVALTFLGSRKLDLSAFFSRVSYKGTSEWKEEIVLLNPAPVEDTKATFPDGTTVVLKATDDPRKVFADWLITEKNPWFARALVNRVWAWLLGRGVIHEPDDIRDDNPPSIPALLTALEKAFLKWDVKALFRTILNTRTYQQASVHQNPDAAKYFAYYLPRRIDAEVLVDAFAWLTGAREQYSSPIPEPYTFLPDEHRTILLPDGSISSPFLEMFGRPSRDTGLFSERSSEWSDSQRLFLLNSSVLQKRIEQSPKIRALKAGDVNGLYLLILSRAPTKAELETAQAYFKTRGITPRQAMDDLAWALVNSKEYLFRH